MKETARTISMKMSLHLADNVHFCLQYIYDSVRTEVENIQNKFVFKLYVFRIMYIFHKCTKHQLSLQL